ncbi:protein O-mannosyl-transferase TMTC3 [Aplysia californica]|uniref:dolichyl-phosphate-mannose--protein mannosyltransferase n=1 Tax=Aplysia californica TaxID=6500 RepID=A0ABM1A3H4_APLCA|nr:protein O-mannosyl-transferase TMTC3 [Aplysia californica]
MQNFTSASVLLCVVVGVIYHNALWCGFVFDDMSAIVENKDLRPATPFFDLFLNDFWGTPMYKEKSHKSYRPLCVATFRMNYALGELDPTGYHLLNVVLHAIVCVMFMKVCSMFMSDLISFLSALLFAVHPIHTEAVTGVVGRAETLSSIFFLGAFLSYSKATGYRKKTDWKPLLMTVFLVTVAMLCKEQGITVIGVCCVFEIFVVQRSTLQELWLIFRGLLSGKGSLPNWLKTSIVRAGFLVFGTTFLLFARIKVMGAQLPVFTNFDNPASQAPAPARQLTFNYLLPVNAWLLLNPSELCCDWTMGTLPLVTSLLDARNVATLLFYAGMAGLGIFAITQQSKRSRTVVMSLSLLVLPFIPASNLFFPVGFVVAERILYTPSLGFCMLVALGFQVLYDRVKWKSYQARIAPSHLNAYLNLANLVSKDPARLDKAEQNVNPVNLYYDNLYYSVQPDDIGAHINVGRTYVNLNRSAPAEKAYLKAIDLFPPIKKGKSYQARIAPSHLNAYLNLANLVSKDPDRLDKAEQLLRQAITMRADYVEAYINLGDILVKLGRLQDAKNTYEAAIAHDPVNADLYYNTGVVLLELGKPLEAKNYFETAIRHNPEHWQSLYNSAILMQEGGNPRDRPLALERLEKLKKNNEKDPKVYFNYAMLAMDEEKFEEAEANFRKAIELDPKFRSALFNLALMLVNNLKRPLDAVPLLKTLLEHYPDHDKGLILMGDINVNVLKDLDAAEKNFNTILARDATNVQALHNLCVVYVERGDLLRAEKCLVQAAQLAPKAEYIQNHLRIVKSRIAEIRKQMAAGQQANAGQKPTGGSQQQTQKTDSGKQHGQKKTQPPPKEDAAAQGKPGKR